MLRTHSLFKRISAAAASAAIAAVSFSGVSAPLSASAGDGITLSMKVLAGGSQIGVAYIVSGAPEGFTFSIDDKEYYPASDGSFVMPEDAMDIGHRHNIVISKDGDTLKEVDYSVVDYLKELTQYDEYADYKPLALSMLLYGGAAQKYFGIDLEKDIPAAGEADIAAVDVNIDAEPFDKDAFNDALAEVEAPVSYYGMNLSLLSETTFRLFFERVEGGVTDSDSFFVNATFNGEAATVKKNGDHYIEVSVSVPASELTETFTLESLLIDQDFSPMQYFAAATAPDQPNAELAALCRTLYAYSLEAKKLADNPPQPPQPSEEKWQTLSEESGKVTVYSPSSEGGSSNLDTYAEDMGYYTCAVNNERYDNANFSGAFLEVKCERTGNTIQVLVGNRDGNSQMEFGDIDLLSDAFGVLTNGETTGAFPITWRLIPSPAAEDHNITYRFKSGSSRYWCELQLQNYRYPVKKLEMMRNGSYVEVERKEYNFFLLEEHEVTGTCLDEGPLTFRITDYFDQVVEETIEPDWSKSASADYIVEGNKQFDK